MSKTERELTVEIVDMLTEWFEEQSNFICTECAYNRYKSDIDYSECPADHCLNDCPNMLYDLENELSAIADRLITILPEPEDE